MPQITDKSTYAMINQPNQEAKQYLENLHQICASPQRLNELFATKSLLNKPIPKPLTYDLVLSALAHVAPEILKKQIALTPAYYQELSEIGKAEIKDALKLKPSAEDNQVVNEPILYADMARRSTFSRQRHGFGTFVNLNQKPFVFVDSSTNFALSNGPFITIGASGREAPYLDPSDPTFIAMYEELKQEITDLDGNLEENPKIMELALRIVFLAVRKKLHKTFEGLSDDYQFITIKGRNHNRGIKAVNLSEFMRKGEGVCRHMTMLNCGIISQLVKDGVFPPHIDVRNHRDSTLSKNGTTGAHQLCLVLDRDKRWVVDSSIFQMFDASKASNIPKTYRDLVGDKFLSGINNRYKAAILKL